MFGSEKVKGLLRALVILIFIAGCSMQSFAEKYSLRNPQVEVDGVRYLLRYYYGPKHPPTGPYENYDGYEFTLPNVTKLRLNETIKTCQAVKAFADFRFYDDSRVPAFSDMITVIKSNTPFRSNLESYDADKDEMARRYPYYTGEVWLQDSLPMPALPEFRKTKYYIVGDMDANLFGEKLTFIRTPRYAVVRTGMFSYCTGLHTARIGTAQLVETEAFKNCRSLGTVFFETAPYVRDGAFKNCPNIRYVVMDGKLPKPVADENEYYDYPDYDYYDYHKEDRSPFDKEVYEQAILYVHEDQMEAFRQDKTWGKFMNIRDIEEYMARVENVTPDTAMVYDVYDLSGMHVRTARSGENWRDGLPAGLYILKSSLGTVRKELIK